MGPREDELLRFAVAAETQANVISEYKHEKLLESTSKLKKGGTAEDLEKARQQVD